MEIKTKIIILVITWFILFGGNYSRPDVRPEVNVGDYISDFESMGYAGLFHMMGTVSADEVKPDNITQCNGKGKVSYDGGTSWTDCPGCPSCKKTAIKENAPATPENDVIIEQDHLPRTVLITQLKTCTWCRKFDRDVVALLRNEAHKKSGWKVGNKRSDNFQIIDLDDPTAEKEIEDLKLDFLSLPTMFFLQSDGSYKSFEGYMDYKTYIDWAKPSKKVKQAVSPTYTRMSKTRWNLNGDYTPNREVLINHLMSEHCITVHLEELSYEELLAIHDDDHNGKLGRINEF